MKLNAFFEKLSREGEACGEIKDFTLYDLMLLSEAGSAMRRSAARLIAHNAAWCQKRAAEMRDMDFPQMCRKYVSDFESFIEFAGRFPNGGFQLHEECIEWYQRAKTYVLKRELDESANWQEFGFFVREGMLMNHMCRQFRRMQFFGRLKDAHAAASGLTPKEIVTYQERWFQGADWCAEEDGRFTLILSKAEYTEYIPCRSASNLICQIEQQPEYCFGYWEYRNWIVAAYRRYRDGELPLRMKWLLVRELPAAFLEALRTLPGEIKDFPWRMRLAYGRLSWPRRLFNSLCGAAREIRHAWRCKYEQGLFDYLLLACHIGLIGSNDERTADAAKTGGK